MGNRAVRSATLWPVVLAMEKAFPVLMSPAVDAVRTVASSEHLTDGLLATVWVKKACLRTHCRFRREQYQIIPHSERQQHCGFTACGCFCDMRITAQLYQQKCPDLEHSIPLEDILKACCYAHCIHLLAGSRGWQPAVPHQQGEDTAAGLHGIPEDSTPARQGHER